MGLICHGAMTAALAGVNEIWMKTPSEVGTTPDVDDHLPSLRASRQVLDMIGTYRMPDEAVSQECSMIEREVDCLFNNILELGEGDVIVGAYRAYQSGSMEWPYSHTKYTAGKVLLVRDSLGAIRVLDPGHLPFDKEILEFHREKVSKNKVKKEEEKGVKLGNFDLVLDSIYTLGAEARCIESFETGLGEKKKGNRILETVPYKGKITVILGVLNDIHHIGIDIMLKYLEKQNVKVISVGTMADQDDFIGAAKEAGADAIFISTSNGMGEVDCDGLRDKCIEAGLRDIIIYVGGHLSVNIRKESWEVIEERYKSLGINRAYAPHVSLDTVFRDLINDLGRDIERQTC
jgi:methylaspartate mutase S subunit